MSGYEINVNQSARNRARVDRALKVPYLRGADDPQAVYAEVEAAFRDMATVVEDLRSQLTQAGMGGMVVRAEEGFETGITAGRLVHVRSDGVAMLAVNSDPDRYCTHVVAGVLPKGNVNVYGYGHWPVCCLPFTNPGDVTPLYLSSVPGHATDVAPDAESVEVYQRIGERMTVQDAGSNVAFCVFKPEFFPTSSTEPDYPVTSVNGETGDVSLGIQDMNDYDGTNPILDGAVPMWNEVQEQFEPVTITGSSTGGGGILGDYIGDAAEAGITANMLVHVDAAGMVWKADATSYIRFATHWVRSSVGTAGGDVVCTAIPSEYSVFCDNEDPFSYSSILYLSDVAAGYATPKPPVLDDSGKIRQIVGTMTSTRNSGTSKCTAVLNIQEAVLG